MATGNAFQATGRRDFLRAGGAGMAFVGYGNHEQYFFKDYFAYQPEYMEKEELCARALAESGHRFIFMEELAGS